eukprot:202165-Chlamydomonas_euryale.AAC.1
MHAHTQGHDAALRLSHPRACCHGGGRVYVNVYKKQRLRSGERERFPLFQTPIQPPLQPPLQPPQRTRDSLSSKHQHNHHYNHHNEHKIPSLPNTNTTNTTTTTTTTTNTSTAAITPTPHAQLLRAYAQMQSGGALSHPLPSLLSSERRAKKEAMRMVHETAAKLEAKQRLAASLQREVEAARRLQASAQATAVAGGGTAVPMSPPPPLQPRQQQQQQQQQEQQQPPVNSVGGVRPAHAGAGNVAAHQSVEVLQKQLSAAQQSAELLQKQLAAERRMAETLK